MNDQLISMVQNLIGKGAMVKIGKRVVHVVLADDQGSSTVRMPLSQWMAIRPSLKVRARDMQEGLKP